jgi:hypothetical protein
VPIAATDWNEVTALATCGLVVGVAVALWGVWAARDAAQKDLIATREAAAAAERATRLQVEASYRPLLIDVPRFGPITPDMESFPDTEGGEGPSPLERSEMPNRINVQIGPRLWVKCDPREPYVELEDEPACVSVPLRNVGWGLAVVDEAVRVGVADQIYAVFVDRPRVPPGETTRVTVLFTPAYRADEATGFTLTVPYADFVGRQVTEAAVSLLEEESGVWRVESVDHVHPDDGSREQA